MSKPNIISYWEHCGAMKDFFISEGDSKSLDSSFYEKRFKKTHRGLVSTLPCFTLIRKKEEEPHSLETGYFIGVDWVIENETAIYIAPKLNKEDKEIDFIQMLFSSLRHSDVTKEINELFEVKWDEPVIEIEQKQDLLTPFLVVEFLGVLKNIVRKGLKKSYYQVETNLHSKVKGKVMVGKTIKQNLMQNKNLHTYCSYEEFGLNNKENRLLNKALTFVKRYLPTYDGIVDTKQIQDTFNYINPAFQTVSKEIELNEIKHAKTNAFYKEYEQAIHLAKMILKRFGYNISNTVKQTVKIPPFWIDMSKLFELYVLGLLKDRFHNEVIYQFQPDGGNELDYLLNSESYKMVVDAKYKVRYIDGKCKDEDIRQVSGYARLLSVYNKLEKPLDEIIDCLIIHPDQGEKGLVDLLSVELISEDHKVDKYNKVFHVGIRLPEVL